MSAYRLSTSVLVVGAALVGLSVAAEARDAAKQEASASTSETRDKAAYSAEERVNRAVVTVGKMKQDPEISKLLTRANGVLIVPHFVKAAAIVGGQGGEAVLLVRRDHGWSDPAFYHIGGASIGAQIGGQAGSMALLLMNDKAVDAFKEHSSNWSLDGSVGLTIVDYSAGAAKVPGEGDVVVWSDTKGLFGGASVGVRNIGRDEDADRAYYGDPHVSSEQILAGDIHNPHRSNAKLLQDVLPLRVASK